jgi:hypothetical protein
MFFMGILLSVEALNAAGLLQLLATDLTKAVPDVNIIAAAIGLASAVIDNVCSCDQPQRPGLLVVISKSRLRHRLRTMR